MFHFIPQKIVRKSLVNPFMTGAVNGPCHRQERVNLSDFYKKIVM